MLRRKNLTDLFASIPKKSSNESLKLHTEMGIFKTTSWMAQLWLCNAIYSKERDNYPNLSKHLTFQSEPRIHTGQSPVKEKGGKNRFSWFCKRLFCADRYSDNQVWTKKSKLSRLKQVRHFSCLFFYYYAYFELKLTLLLYFTSSFFDIASLNEKLIP